MKYRSMRSLALQRAGTGRKRHVTARERYRRARRLRQAEKWQRLRGENTARTVRGI